MKNKIGAVVAIEPSSGEIIALVSTPSYNPNQLIGRKRSDNYKTLSKDKNKPLFNRALQGTYPPGSTFKLINGLIALQEGAITKYNSFNCSGDNGYSYGNDKNVGCHSHLTPLKLKKGIELSSNTYFCNILIIDCITIVGSTLLLITILNSYFCFSFIIFDFFNVSYTSF